MPTSDACPDVPAQAGPVATTTSSRMAILWATLTAGALDISAAILTWWFRDVAPSRVLQSVAGGLLGRDATFSGGAKTAALGLFLHFAIMSGIAAVFYAASRRLPGLVGRRWWLAGIAYGVAVYAVMTFVVVPLSALAPARPVPVPDIVQGVFVHMLCVGLPIAFITRRFSRRME
jgi:hypothetical protein